MRTPGNGLKIIITILIMLFIFVQSALPADLSSKESNVIVLLVADLLQEDADKVSFLVRKCAHFTEYLVLGMSLVLTVRGWMAARHRSIRRIGIEMLIAWCIGTAYAITDEVHQHFVQGRSCELRDMAIDSCGVAVGILIIWLIRHRKWT